MFSTEYFVHICIFVIDYYDFHNPPRISDPPVNIPLTLSILPYLEKLTLHSKQFVGHRWGFQSPFPWITQLFSSKPPSSFKLLTLNLNCIVPSLSVSDVICNPLVQLLSAIESASEYSESSQLIHVDLYLSLCDKPMPLLLLSPLDDCTELKKFLDQNMLSFIPLDAVVEDSIGTDLFWLMNSY